MDKGREHLIHYFFDLPLVSFPLWNQSGATVLHFKRSHLTWFSYLIRMPPGWKSSGHVQLVGNLGLDPEQFGELQYLIWPENTPGDGDLDNLASPAATAA